MSEEAVTNNPEVTEIDQLKEELKQACHDRDLANLERDKAMHDREIALQTVGSLLKKHEDERKSFQALLLRVSTRHIRPVKLHSIVIAISGLLVILLHVAMEAELMSYELGDPLGYIAMVVGVFCIAVVFERLTVKRAIERKRDHGNEKV